MKKNKLIAALLSVCMVGGIGVTENFVSINNVIINAEAADYTEGTYGVLKYYKYSDHVEIQKCDKSAATVNIPGSIEGLPVTKLNTFSFMGCKQLTSVTIPEGVTQIGSWAFDSCTSLASITLPSSIEKIGSGAFTGTPVLENVNGISYVGNALIKCEDTSVTHVDVRSGTTVIAGDAFQDCSKLQSVSLPEGVTAIGASAFWKCSGLTSIQLPKTVKSIGSNAFYGCSSLNNIVIPEGVEKFSGGTFSGCTSLSKISLPDSLKQIYRGDFENTAIMTAQTGVKYADKWVVGCDEDVESASLRSDTKGIGYGAFEKCTSLKDVSLPMSVSVVGEDAFYGCSGLRVTVYNPSCDIFKSPYTFPKNAVICGYDDSTAHKFAKSYGIEFVSLGKLFSMGDVNFDGTVDAMDASLVLIHYSCMATGGNSEFNENQKSAADVNADNAVDALDASYILSYYAYRATGGTQSMDVYMNKM